MLNNHPNKQNEQNKNIHIALRILLYLLIYFMLPALVIIWFILTHYN